MSKEISNFYGATLEKTFSFDGVTEMVLKSKKPLNQSQIDCFIWETKKYSEIDIPLIWCDNITQIYLDIEGQSLILVINNKIEVEIGY